mgnify:FL=1|nr:MAG TPA: Large Terminase [Bacteriophage sp.]
MTDKNLVKNAVFRQSFSTFVQKCFYELNPSEKFINGMYIDLLCDQIQSMIEGENQKLIINLPPRYLKSVICSIALPAFILGHNPSAKIMCISYGEELASKLATDCRTIMETDWYKELFFQTRIRGDRRSSMDFETTKHGGRFAVTISGGVTGRGADWIIIDDPLKPVEAFSDIQREKVNELYGNTVNSRLNDKNTGRILVVMQRLHAHDLSGFLFENDPDFKSIVLPLIAVKDEEWQIKNHITGKIVIYKRKKGELLHPEREGEKVVNSYRNSMSPFVFSAQYQQNPIPIGSGMIKQEWVTTYQELPKLSKIILSWDTASKTTETNAYSACVVIGVGKDQKYYLLEVFRGRLDFPSLTRKVKELSDKYEGKMSGKIITLVENASSGISLCQTLKGKITNLIPVSCKSSKEQRFDIVALKTEQGELLFPGQYEPWFKSFEDEFLTFPRSLFKDQCDALSQAIGYFEEHKHSLRQAAVVAIPSPPVKTVYTGIIGTSNTNSNISARPTIFFNYRRF